MNETINFSRIFSSAVFKITSLCLKTELIKMKSLDLTMGSPSTFIDIFNISIIVGRKFPNTGPKTINLILKHKLA